MKICMVIGDPIEHSLSPQIHNAGYEALGIDNEFVYVSQNVKLDKLREFIEAVRIMEIRGISCTIPHKIEVLNYLDEIDETAQKIGAVNTIVNTNGTLKGYNTDWLGIVVPLEKITSLKDKKVALIGAGGAARAVAYGITQKGAKLTIFNRSFGKAKSLANEFGCEAKSVNDLGIVKDMDIIINATSVGLFPDTTSSPLPKDMIISEHIVFDIIYNPLDTKLLKDAKEKGAKIIHGYEMLLEQALAQFKLYTDHDAPSEAMRKILLDNLERKK